MFGIGPLEMVVIAVAILIFVGPKRLPEMMNQFGKFFVQAKRYSGDVRESVQGAIREAEVQLRLEEAERLKAEAKKLTDELKPENVLNAEISSLKRDISFEEASGLSHEAGEVLRDAQNDDGAHRKDEGAQPYDETPHRGDALSDVKGPGASRNDAIEDGQPAKDPTTPTA